jgi:PIN domain nuclease of toxin-antitoxin system
MVTTLLWYLQDDSKLSTTVAEILESTEKNLYFSIVSLWEIAIKLGISQLELQFSFDELRNALTQFAIKILPIQLEDTRQYLNLSLHHRDPFDRI